MLTYLRKVLLTILFAAFASQASAMFIQPDTPDPNQPGVGTNRYAYSGDDPINLSDPTGNSWLDETWDGVFGANSFNNTFGEKASAWSDRTFGNDVEKWAGYSYQHETAGLDASAKDYPGFKWWNNYNDYKSQRVEGASGKAIASNIDIDIALMSTGIGPALRGGSLIYDSAVASMNPARVFWSGRSAATGISARVAAEAYARENGATTLEMTLSGRILDAVTTKSTFKYLEPLWARASARFAAGADSATVFRGTLVRPNNVWDTIERPILENRGVQYFMNLLE